MLTGSDTGLPSRREHVKTPRRKKGQAFIEHLRSVTRQHQVCYEVWPVLSVYKGVREGVGFELMLCGVSVHTGQDENALQAVPYCQHCAQIYDDLRELAEWILDLKKPPFNYEPYSFDHALHLAPPTRQHRSEVIMTTAIFFHTNHNAATYDCDSDCLKEVRERLSKLGIQEDVWLAAASATA